MEPQDEVAEKESVELTVDFSKQTLKRIERAECEHQLAEILILDHNQIQKLDNLETYPNLKKLSIVNNQLVRMYGVSTLLNLTTLNISNNALVIIEGLKNLTKLTELNLSKNRIKTIENLKQNIKLEKLDLSGNCITSLSDISYLENLKEFKLNGNRINHMKQCEKYLPLKLEVFMINNNLIPDLNEVSYLGHLTSLRELSIANNPCLDFSADQKFNYRPFVKNWISSLVILDNCPLDDIECLKAEWLYSQGRGRSFRPGEHAALIEYLNSVCPKEVKENAETEDVKKLKLILSKAQLHQQQLREQLSAAKISSGELKTSVNKKKFSDRMVTSFQDSPSRDHRSTPELMTRSLDSGSIRKPLKISKPELNNTPLQTSTTFLPIPDTLISPEVGQPMIRSCPGPSSISSRTSRSSSRNSPHSTPESKRKSSVVLIQRRKDSSPVVSKRSGKVINSRSSTPLDLGGSPGKSTPSRNVMSPLKKESRSGSRPESRKNSDRNRETSEEEDSESRMMKSGAAQQKASPKNINKSHRKDTVGSGKTGNAEKNKNSKKNEAVYPDLMDLEGVTACKAAVCIQRRWRGYRARNLNTEVLRGCKSIQMNRMQDYITKVVNDMEATRVALEGNRRLVVLQMQAINSLWKKISALQPSVGSSASENQMCLQNLVESCSNLNKQVEGLHVMIRNMQASSTSIPLVPTATQTEIVAVHTPQGGENGIFPYNPNQYGIQHSSSLYSIENDDKCNDENSKESDYTSTTSTMKTIELYNNSNVDDSSLEETFPVTGTPNETDTAEIGETLTKPAIKLSETNNQVPSSNENLENSEKEAESEDGCNS